MIIIQILNKILSTGDLSIYLDNEFIVDDFGIYKEHISFMLKHYDKYDNVPDITTFLNKFPDFEIFDVNESDTYLIDTFNEELLFKKAAQVISKSAELLRDNSIEATNYLISELPNLKISNKNIGIDIIQKSEKRLKLHETRKEKNPHIPTGFNDLDKSIGGWDTYEELAIIVARTGQGKSWFITKILLEAWKLKKRVGFISPEMSDVSIGYRFDTLYKNFSNKDLVRGNKVKGYRNYIKELRDYDGFIVATPKDFSKNITITKLRNFIKNHKLDILAIDGLTYLTDERYVKGDMKHVTLTNISEDLVTLSKELRCPQIVAVQANRSFVKNKEKDSDDVPDVEHIKDADGIGHSATKIISLKQKDDKLIMVIKKNRSGFYGEKFTYEWDIDNGLLTPVQQVEYVSRKKNKNDNDVDNEAF